jgi:DNA-binding CsgD family transcriptional regulator
VLLDRTAECAKLDGLLTSARAGKSEAFVLRGEAGIGKTALLDYVAGHATGCRIVRASGVESEMELPFAGLHQLCATLIGDLGRLPPPQHEALGTAFGFSLGAPPDRFLIGLAVLTLLSDAAEDQPLVCLVDDTHWLDRSSAQVLAFVARRLDAESVVLVLAQRETAEPDEFARLPGLRLRGLSSAYARELLATVIRGPLDERVRQRIVAEARGNPLALVELPNGLSPARLAGGFGLPHNLPLQGRIEESFRRQVERLPTETRRLLLVAAAESRGEPTLLWRAATELGIPSSSVGAAQAAGLLELGARVAFRHPLLRSAIYQAASAEDRQSTHRALAAATDAEMDPDRRAWHRAHATLEPDEDVAGELERSAGRARSRGGLAAAAAFLERAAALTPDPHLRARRALGAASAAQLAGSPEAALTLLAIAGAGPLDEFDRALSKRLYGQIALDMRHGSDAAPLLLDAARQLTSFDAALGRETLTEALRAASIAGRLGGGMLAAAEAARTAPPPPGPPGAIDLLLDGLAVRFTEGYAASAPALKRALGAVLDEESRAKQDVRWPWFARRVAPDLFQDEIWLALATRNVQIAREAGALSVLPLALNYLALIRSFEGALDAADALVDEADAIADATGTAPISVAAPLLAGCRGDEAQATAIIAASEAEAIARGEGVVLTFAEHARAILYNGLGRYEEALLPAQSASARDELMASVWSLPELVEAATRCGRPADAAAAFERLRERTRAAGTDLALGIEARSRALLVDGEEAEGAFREAVDRLGRCRARLELARAHLLLGEWLRRANRRADAREPLRTAHEMFTSMGAEAFASRAARELSATGEKARPRSASRRERLTPQEGQIAQLARDGHTNPEIGAHLFISPRTVQYHLGKVFSKLNINSRSQLEWALPGKPSEPLPVAPNSHDFL